MKITFPKYNLNSIQNFEGYFCMETMENIGLIRIKFKIETKNMQIHIFGNVLLTREFDSAYFCIFCS